MTGKDFGLVLFVAVAASAGTAAAAHVLRGDDGTADRLGSLATRLDRIEQALAKADETARENLRLVTDCRARLDAVESHTAALSERAPAANAEAGTLEEPARPGRAKRIVVPGSAAPVRISKGDLLGGDGESTDLRVEGGRLALGQAVGAMEGEFQGLSNGLQMRMMPEAERWAKAKEELGLSDGQVDLLKRAVADRDAAMKDAMQVTREGESDAGGRFSVRRLDPAKASAAQDAFKSVVNQTLDDGQKKTWKDKGYDHAFGGRSGGGAIVIASEINLEGPGEKSPK